jgi:hypothetical protein
MSPRRFSEPGYPRGGLHGQIVHAIGRQILNEIDLQVIERTGPSPKLPLPVAQDELALKLLRRDGVTETVWSLSETGALILDRSFRLADIHFGLAPPRESTVSSAPPKENADESLL